MSQQSGLEWDHQRRAHKTEYPLGATSHVQAHGDGGLIIGRCKTVRILLDADETARLIEVARELTPADGTE